MSNTGVVGSASLTPGMHFPHFRDALLGDKPRVQPLGGTRARDHFTTRMATTGARGDVVRGAARQNLHHHLSLLFAFILVFSSSHHLSAKFADAAALPELSSYSSMALLDPRFELYWSTNTSDATIHMAARAQTAGWLAIGLSESGGMFGSDVVVAWVAEREGRVYATDRFVFNKTGEGVALDEQQDWRVLGGSQTTDQSTGDTWTTVHVWRQLDTGDCNDRPITAGALSFVIWAMGTTDELAYHSATRGATSLVLLPAPGPSILDPTTPPTTTTQSADASWPAITSAGKLAAYAQGQANGQKNGQAKGQGMAMGGDGRFNLTMVNHRVSTNYTTYMCKVRRLLRRLKNHRHSVCPPTLCVPTVFPPTCARCVPPSLRPSPHFSLFSLFSLSSLSSLPSPLSCSSHFPLLSSPSSCSPLISCLASLSSPALLPSHLLPCFPLISCLASLSSPALLPSHLLPCFPLISCLVSLSSPALLPSHLLPCFPLISCLAPLSSPALLPSHLLPCFPLISCLASLSSPALLPSHLLPCFPLISCLASLSSPALLPSHLLPCLS
ncbi:unnamed protein product [Closterium sp. Yama58-4]|nr:unnamed protein product [Closterium sp. Yama58-4]